MKINTSELKILRKKIHLKQERLKKKDINPNEKVSKVYTEPLLQMFSGMLIGSYLGYNLDSYLRTLPAFLFLFTILGVAGGIYNCYNPVGYRKSKCAIKSQKNE